MNADAELDALVWGNLSVALDHRPLDFDGAVHSIDDAAEVNDGAVAGALDDAAMMHGDGWVDQIAPKGPKPCEDAIFVRSSKPGVTDNVGDQDRGQLAGLAHGASADAGRSPGRGGLGMAAYHAALRRTWKQGMQAPACRPAGLSTPR
jgi:hypothetical protein